MRMKNLLKEPDHYADLGREVEARFQDADECLLEEAGLVRDLLIHFKERWVQRNIADTGLVGHGPLVRMLKQLKGLLDNLDL